MADNVNIYNPFWTFFFIFFLFYNIFFMFHHFSFHSPEKTIPPFKPQNRLIAPNEGTKVATTTKELQDYGQQFVANTPDLVPQSKQGSDQPQPLTAYEETSSGK